MIPGAQAVAPVDMKMQNKMYLKENGALYPVAWSKCSHRTEHSGRDICRTIDDVVANNTACMQSKENLIKYGSVVTKPVDLLLTA